MKDFFKSFGFKALAAVALVLVGIMIYAASTGGVATIPATIVGAIVSPLQSLASGISDGFSGFIGNFTDGGELKEQNERLQKEITELRENQVELDELRRQVDQYKEYLGIKEKNPDYQFADCRVIYRDPAGHYGNFTINKGSLDGIKAKDPVITPHGLVGVVYETGLNWAKVRTILDPDTQASAYVSRVQSEGSGVSGGSVSLAKEGLLQLNLLPRDTGAAAGDIVITSGVGGIFPAGRLIGEVTEVHADSDGLTAYAIVKPYVDIAEVDTVFVITAFSGQGDSEK